ncbi:MAG: 30S ribosomal protein S8 [Planctomycetota bacterium]|nr:MAG: 30S ribosomal protein S8 [Planctomycetota bacterium]
MWTDPIADLLTRIRNGVHNRAKHVAMPYSNFKLAICRVLKDEGYIADVERIEGKPTDVLRVTLKYGPRGEQVLRSIRRESKAGCRKYVAVDEIPKVLNGLGIAIVSTSRGVMSDRKCRQERLGGELVCTAY